MRSTLAIGATAAMLLGLAGPANATRATATDPRRDARASLDITKVTFRHNADGAYAKVHVRDLRQRGQFVFAVANRSGSLRFGVVATGRPDAPPVKRFYRFRDGDLTRVSCRGDRVRWRPARDTVTLSFPVRCFRALPQRVALRVDTTVNFPDRGSIDAGPSVVLRR